MSASTRRDSRLRRSILLGVRSRSRNRRTKTFVELDRLEDRTLLTAVATPTLSINDVKVLEQTGSVATETGTLNPGTQAVTYRIDGYAGQSLDFHSVSLSPANSGTWTLYEPNNQVDTRNNLGSDFTAFLPNSGFYNLVLEGNASTAVSYQFQVSDVTPKTVALSGPFNTVESGSVAANSTQTFTFTAPAGTPIYFNDQLSTSNSTINLNLTGPSNYSAPSLVGNVTILPASGTYTLSLANPLGSAQNYQFEMLSLPTASQPLSLATTEQGTLNPGYSAAVYSFSGAPGEHLFFNDLSASSVAPELYTPEGNLVFGGVGQNRDLGPITLDESGTYYLVLTGNQSASESYQFQLLDPTTTDLSLNTSTSGTLSSGLDANVYQFSGTAGERVYLKGLTDSNSGAAYALYAPDNQQLAKSSSTSQDAGAVVLPATGTYFVVVTGTNANNSSDSYSFTVWDTVTSTQALTTGTEYTGTIADPGDQAVFTFQGTAGQTLFLNNLGLGSNLAYTFYNAENQNINANPYDTGPQDLGPIVLTQTGSYTLVVAAASPGSDPGATGSYDFRVLDPSQQAQPDPQASTITLMSGQATTVAGTLSTGLTVDLYTFSGAAGERLYLQGGSDSNPGGAEYTLFGFNNQRITSSDTESDAGVTILPATGTYLIAVSGQSASNSSDSYSFKIWDAVSPSQSITTGTTAVSGTIKNPGDQAIYTFQGTAGQTLYLNNLGLANGLSYTIYDPAGNDSFLDSSGITSDFGPVQLQLTGTYQIVINGSGADTGNYSFRLLDPSQQSQPDPQASTITLASGQSTSVSGTLSTGLETNLYTFSGTAGERLYFQGGTDSNANGAFYAIYGPNDARIAGEYTESDAGLAVLPVSGTYLIAVEGRSASNSTDSYSFKVWDAVTTSQTMTTGPTGYSGTIADPGDQAVFTFQGTSGQTLYLDNLGLANGISYNFFDPQNSLVNLNYYSSNYDAAGDLGPYTLTQSGTYTLIINGGNSSATGSYDFRLLDPSQSNQAKPITLSTSATTLSGTLAGLTTDLYTFQGTAGEVIAIQAGADSNTNGAYYTLFGSDNSSIVARSVENGIGSITLPATGTYLIAVAGQSAAYTVTPEMYSFSISVTSQPTPPTVSYISTGTEYSGSITSTVAQEVYYINGTAGQTLLLNSLGLTGSVSYNLYDPNGTNLIDITSGNGENVLGPFTLNQSGTYKIVVAANFTGATGTYDFELLNASQATSIALSPDTATKVTGTLAKGLSTELFSFQGTAGQTLYLQGGTDSTSDASNYQIFNPNDQQNGVGVYVEESQGLVTLPATGTYLIVVAGTSSTNSNVSFSFNVWDTVTTSQPLSLGTVTNGTINNPGDQQVYTFQGVAGQELYFDGLQSASSLYFQLNDPYGHFLGSTSGIYASSGSDFGPVTLLESGSYQLVVNANRGSSTGSFSFRMTDVSTVPTISPTISSPAEISGTLSTGISTDLYQLTTTVPNETITVQALSGVGTAELLITDQDGNDYLYGLNNSVGENNRITLPFIGTYTIAVVGESPSSGGSTPVVSYAYKLWRNQTTTTALSTGTVYSGNIANPGDQAIFTYNGTAGQTLYFNNMGLANELTMTIENPEQSLGNLAIISGSSDFGPITLTQTGTYLFVIGSDSNLIAATGSYGFRVLDPSQSSQATAITPTTTVSGTLTSGLAANLYTFQGIAGENVYIQGLSDSISQGARYSLYAPDDQNIASDFAESSSGLVTLPASGTYIIAVEGQSAANSSVSYSFNVDVTSDATDSLTLGQNTSGTIAGPGDTHTYSFFAYAGQTFFLNVLTRTSGLQIAVNDPVGSQIAYTHFNYEDPNIEPFAVSATGTYTLVASGSNGTVGPYNFNLFDVSAQPEIQVGTVDEQFTVSLSTPSSHQVTVNYQSADNTALAGVNYRPVGGLLLFAPGQTSETISVQVLNNVDITKPLTYFINLTNPTFAPVSIDQGIGTITSLAASTADIALTASPGTTTTYGQSVAFTATVTPQISGNATPTGAVQFEIDGTDFGSPVSLNANGVALSSAITTLAAGTHSIEAVY